MTATAEPGVVADDPEMLDCLREYRGALGVLAAVEAAAEPDPDEHLAASEAVIAARTRMTRLLVESGWEPTEDVAAALDLDLAITAEDNGALGG